MLAASTMVWCVRSTARGTSCVAREAGGVSSDGVLCAAGLGVQLKLPKEYPMKPPAIKMLTPNGRFQVNRRLCLSMSGDVAPYAHNPAHAQG